MPWLNASRANAPGQGRETGHGDPVGKNRRQDTIDLRARGQLGYQICQKTQAL